MTRSGSRFDVHVHGLPTQPGDTTKLDQILECLNYLIERIDCMSAEMDRLSAQVAVNTNVERSAIVLIEGIAQQLRDAGGDPVALAALADSLQASSEALAAAVAANTPASPSA